MQQRGDRFSCNKEDGHDAGCRGPERCQHRCSRDRSGGACLAQHGQQQHHGHHGNVLEQENARGKPAVGRVDLNAISIHFEYDGRAAERGEKAEEHCLRHGKAEYNGDPRHDSDGDEDLGGAADQELPARADNVGQRELDAHGEQQQHHAYLGEAFHYAQFGYDRRSVGADHHAGDQEAHNGRQLHLMEQECDGERYGQQDDELS